MNNKRMQRIQKSSRIAGYVARFLQVLCVVFALVFVWASVHALRGGEVERNYLNYVALQGGLVQAENLSNGQIATLFGMASFSTLVAAVVLEVICRTCKRFAEADSPFAEEVSKSVQKLGLVLLSVCGLELVLEAIFQWITTKNLMLSANFGLLLGAGIAFALSEILRYGREAEMRKIA